MGQSEISMPLLLAALAQAISGVPPERIDLLISQPCATRTAARDEVVVCANRAGGPSPYRISQPPLSQAQMPKAEVQLADGVSVAAETEQADILGFPSNRAVLRLKLKF
jgi:hypothetical protein